MRRHLLLRSVNVGVEIKNVRFRDANTVFRYVQVLMFVSQWKTLWTPASVILLYIPYSMQMYKGMLGSIRSKQDLPSTYLEYLILSEICSTQNLSATA